MTEEFILRNKKNAYPACSGVYFLIDKNEIVYIGSAREVYKRMKTHSKNHRIFYDSYYIYKTKDYLRKEEEFIKQFKPKYNFTHHPDYKSGKKEILCLFMTKFKDLVELSEITGLTPTTVSRVVFNKGAAKKETRLIVDNAVLQRSTNKKRIKKYLEYRKKHYGF